MYLGSQVLTRVLAALLGVYAARVLGPEQLGLWAVFQIVFLYTGQAHLGTVNAMLREVPIARAQKDETRARDVVECVWGFVWVSAAVTASVVGCAAWLFAPHDTRSVGLTIACAALAFVQLHSVFFTFYCFAFSELSKLAFATLFQQSLTTLSCIFLLPRYGVAGYLGSMSAGFAVMWIANAFGSLPGLRPRFSLSKWTVLIGTGLPMLPGALMLYFGTSVDRLFVASRLGVTALGLFTVGAFLFQFGAALCDVLINTVYARLAALYATAGSNPQRLADVIGRSFAAGMWLSSAVQGLIFIFAPLAITTILPRYTGSIVMAQILVLAINLFGAGQLLTSTLTVIGRERLSVVVRLIGLCLRTISLLAAVTVSKTLAGVAAGIVVGQFAYSVLAFATFRRLTDFEVRPALLGLASWAVASTAAIVCSITARSPDARTALATGVVYGCFVVAITCFVERKNGSISQFLEFARA